MTFDPHNCIVYAVGMRLKYGGRIVCRKSPNGWWFHMWWTPDGVTFWEYTPHPEDVKARQKSHPWLARICPPPFYRGFVKQTGAIPAPTRKAA